MNGTVSAKPVRRRVGGAILSMVGLAGAIALLRTPGGNAIALYGRFDVALIWMLFSVPLALWCGLRMSRWGGLAGRLTAAGLLAAALLVALADTSPITAGGSELALGLLRTAVVAPAVVGIWLLWAPQAQPSHRPEGAPGEGALGIAAVVLAIVVPMTYANAAAERLTFALEESLRGGRLRRGMVLSEQLHALNPRSVVNETRIGRMHPSLVQAVEQLRREAAAPLPPTVPIAAVGRRVVVLMQLERLERALRLVEPMTRGSNFHPISLDYCALCYQRMGEWEESRRWYGEAIKFWESQPDGEQKKQALVSAYKGVAFAERRLENRRAEEEAYQRAVAVAGTGQTHFLLAQCYRDHQKTALARQHAAEAMRLDPQYAEQSRKLIESLVTNHFGCLQTHWAR